jgi:hypothetical protein
VAKYSADIEIAVRGGQQLNNTIKTLNRLNNSVNLINRNAKLLEGKGFNVANMENYSRAVSKAERAVRKAAEGTEVERIAINKLVTAMELENKARERKNLLITREVANQRRVVATANAGFGVQGPAMPSYMQGPAVPPGGIPRRSGSGGGGGGGRSAGGGRSNVGGAISSALIGGGFPLLFGQGPAAAAGGALGGVAGGLLGGGFGFALSIVGTAIGDAITKAEDFSRALISVNSGLAGTGNNATTTSSDISRLASQLGTAKDEALQLVSAFSEFDSAGTREALALSFGALGQKEAFDALAAAVDNKSTLEAIIKLRSIIQDKQAKEALKQLEVNGAAAANIFLQQRLLDLQEQKLVKIAKEVGFMDRLLAAAASLGAGQLIDPSIFGEERATEVRSGAAERKKAQQQALEDTKKFLSETARLNKEFTPETRKGAKPPEDRTAQLREEFIAIVAIGQAEDKVRDLLFEGRELLAAEVELQKQIADIERDRNKALMSANYESERVVITKIAEARIVDAQLKQQDKIREINQKRFEEELQLQEAVRSSVQSFTDMRKEQELQLQYSKTYSRLLMEGMLPAEAERIANFEKIVAAQLKAVDLQVLITSAAITEAKARGASAFQLEKDLDLLERKRKAIEGEAAAGPGAGPTDRERLQTEADRVRGELNTLTDPINAITTAAAGIGDAFSTSFKGIISGSMTAKEALASFFTSVADMFLDMAAQIIAKMIQMAILNTIVGLLPGGGGFAGNAAGFGGTFDAGIPAIGNTTNFASAFGGARANGGPVSSGKSYMVGERGPELFVPGRSGSIVPNGAMGGGVNVVVNVDAKGSSVEGDQSQAKALGNAISAAVQSELVKQKRPGGLLA